MASTAEELLAELKDEERTRAVWQNVFRPTEQTGRDNAEFVLASIAVRCGVHESDPAKLKPELIALWHWLLEELGARHEQNIVPEAHMWTQLANIEDLKAAKKRIIAAGAAIEQGETL